MEEKRTEHLPAEDAAQAAVKSGAVFRSITASDLLMQAILFGAAVVWVNVAFVLSFVIRYRGVIPPLRVAPYLESFLFLTILYMVSFVVTKSFQIRFKSFWELFTRIALGMGLGTLLAIAFVYVFRIRWSMFPSSIFVLCFPLGLLFIFAFNGLILGRRGRIMKRVVILGRGRTVGLKDRSQYITTTHVNTIEELMKYPEVDEIMINEEITHARDMNLLVFIVRKFRAQVLFSPSVYLSILPERINGNASIQWLSTFIGRRSEFDEFVIRLCDVVGSAAILLLALPAMLVIMAVIAVFSPGPIMYRQQRVGKDGKLFTLYKFRTMVSDARDRVAVLPTEIDDPRVTRVGGLLRKLHLDEMPQLVNILKGDMSLVGPRPENLYRVQLHKALRGLRLAVKPGLTGLAQIRGLYDLHPRHKIRYDYLYIQNRSVLFNLYIILRTIPVVLSRKGW